MATPVGPVTLTVGGSTVGTVTRWEMGDSEDPTEAAFWAAIGANPADCLPRLVLADWLEERGRWEEGSGMRETADRVPKVFDDYGNGHEAVYTWWLPLSHPVLEDVGPDLFRHLRPPIYRGWVGAADYPTAESAIRDLCRAWVSLNRTGVTA